ncbi:MAG: hypothetical protein ACE5JD_12725 [Candidatus Methylomirabilia bacterium]
MSASDSYRSHLGSSSQILCFLRYHSPFFGELVPVTDFVGSSDQTGERFLSRTAHLMAATDFFEQAHGNWWLSPDMRLILLMMAAEALFTDDDRGKLAYRLSQRIAVLNGVHSGERKTMFELTKKLYDLRSRLMHGSVYRAKGGFLEVSGPDVSAFTNLVRSSLLYFIALRRKDLGKAEILKTLDRAIFDEKEMLLLRFKANELWGFGESSDEHLYAMGHMRTQERHGIAVGLWQHHLKRSSVSVSRCICK